MEMLDGKIEFLCLGCGLQGMCDPEPDSVGESAVLCPKCGDHLMTTLHLEVKKEPVLATV
ncbi:hypothetical protein [Dethiobacter alkaliphilus]|uniref:Uncharacterized protein n=1 Tax=Dethiobacter alkaliphilus AHT 1 TaxID=555088 RepID=C0GFU7_DETAL|nr:hypothetical protein [Dethiobacter alkaliphilus]EEG77636.1 hypothetical protein DealDRAFT_1356 [Dethiobacter alkaliphilus AHT 1]MCW3491244.1 hypothetical protein [Dethiobacter alkaliphilus]